MRFPSALAGFLAALAPGFPLLSAVFVIPGYQSTVLEASPWLLEAAQYGSIGLGAGAVGAAATSRRLPWLARLLAWVSILGMVGLAAPWLATSPLSTLLALIIVTWLMAWLTDFLGVGIGAYSEVSRLRGAIAAIGLLWLMVLASGASGGLVVFSLALSQLVAGVFQWRLGRGGTNRWVRWASALGVVVPSVLATLIVPAPLFSLTLSFLLLVGLWFLRERERIQGETDAQLWWLDGILVDPSRTLVATFLFGGTVGGFLLALPIASQTDVSIGLLNALFTAFSAICVTGLIVVDTPTVFSSFGQAILLVVIQVGGLGIMTFSTAAILLMGKRMSLKHEITAAALLQTQSRDQMKAMLGRVLMVTAVVEGAGAVLLTLGFWSDGDPFGMALWRGVFTSISAFCNAGFALQTDSLIPYQDDPFILLTISLLIIVGGLGPAVVTEMWSWRPGKRMGLQARLVLWTTGLLLAVPSVLFLALEWRQTLASMGVLDRVVNAWFQSVTMRTAGFNSIDLAAMVPASYSIMLLLMFIGGSPGSTAGGAKTTTMAVLALQLRSVIRGEEHAQVFGFRLSDLTNRRAMAVAFMGFLAFLVVLLALQTTQNIGLREIVFETISALGTVGLSIGATAELDEIGKVIVMFAMFAGRVGPLTLLMFLGSRADGRRLGRPEVAIDIG